AGRVGVHLAKYFADEQQDVFLVDRDSRKLAVLEADFNLRTFQGDPTEFETLRKADAGDADIFVAVTADTAENLVACSMAKSMGAGMTIARVDKYSFLMPDNEAFVKRMGVDHVVFPDYLAAETVISSLEHGWCREWSEFEDSAIIMASVTVNDSSPVARRQLKELSRESRELHVSALRRNHHTIIPGGDDTILPGDILYITVTPEGVETVKQLIGIEVLPIKKAVLMGGSMVSELICRLAGREFAFVIIEKEIERCRELMESCPDSEIICGDGSEIDVLEEAGINKADAFVALTDNTESNILSCLTARDVGVPKNIAEIEKEQLIAKAESFQLGSIINKPIITATAIFQLILDANVDSTKYFGVPDAEIGRIQVKEGTFLTKKRVMDLRLPQGVTFAGMTRDGRGEMVTGTTQFMPGDIVIVFSLAGSLKRVEKLFGR
ncbi:MAG: Trk system potassium transporter TrkA, partial [Muribaculaceae bacterium]|nr:Trk system potassium transporter TrkA [Muribaculaceae bacterium]